MPKVRTYTPAELCTLLKLPKSTLLRWEREGTLRRVVRDSGNSRNQRQYTLSDLKLIAGKQAEQFEKRYNLVAEAENLVTQKQLRDLFKDYELRKFLSGDVMALRELAEASDLSQDTIWTLLRFASEAYKPGDPVFGEIIHAV